MVFGNTTQAPPLALFGAQGGLTVAGYASFPFGASLARAKHVEIERAPVHAHLTPHQSMQFAEHAFDERRVVAGVVLSP